MSKLLEEVENGFLNKCNLEQTNFLENNESREYSACSFYVNKKKVFYRKAKITPTKIGQFVTFWKRKNNGPIEPFEDTDDFEFLIISTYQADRVAFFIFPKDVLVKRGIVTSNAKEGKRGFRLYPKWDIVTSKQAISTQRWQLAYFYELNSELNIKKISDLFEL